MTDRMPTELVYHSIAQSNIPKSEKSGAIDQETGSQKTPVIAGALGAVLAVLSSGTWFETSMRNLSSTGMGIWGYQSGTNFMKEKRLASGTHVAGEAAEDPIIAMGKTL